MVFLFGVVLVVIMGLPACVCGDLCLGVVFVCVGLGSRFRIIVMFDL